MLAGMRIAALIPQAIVNTIYRSLVPMQALAQRGHTVHIEERDELHDPTRLLDCDVVQFMRFANDPMHRLARRLRQHGVAVVWESDDDVAGATGGMMRQQILAGARAMVRTADLVTTPSPVLAARYREMGAEHVAVLPNRLPPIFTRPERLMPHTGVTIGWHVWPDRAADYDQLGLRETLERLLTRHHHVEVVGIGLPLELRSRRYNGYPPQDYGDLPGVIASFDIGLAPLADTPYNQGRSDVKVREYAAVGTPWLASPLAPYAGLGEEQGGRLVPDDRWHQEIEALVLDADARSRLARRGRLWAEGETIEHHAEAWEQAYAAAVERARSGQAVER